MSGDAVAPQPTKCPVCRSEGAPHAKRCARCGEWLVAAELSTVDQVLVALGWVWLVLSLVGALGLFFSIPSSEPVSYGAPAPSGLSGSLGVGIAFALGLQGVVVGLLIISFAQRGPRRP